MRADPEDQLDEKWQRKKSPVFRWLAAALVLLGIAAYWFWSGQQVAVEVALSAPQIAVPKVTPRAPSTPDIPQRQELLEVEVAQVETEVLPASNSAVSFAPPEGDDLLRQQLEQAGADANLSSLVSNENALDVSAALIDGLSRGVIMRKILPVDPPKQAFEVEEKTDLLYMSSSNFTRYDSYADSIAALDSNILINSFHTLRPFYEGAYEQLGLDAGGFDNAVIRTLDVILATPEIDEPIELERKSVLYVYADPALEDLSPVQKLLLRMGPENIRRIKQKAQTIRDGLLSQ
jgi:hypothetical protein